MLKDSILKLLKLDSLMEHITGYVETRIELMKVEVREQLANAISKVLLYVVILSFLMLFVLLFSLAVAYKIGEHLGTFGGFAIVSGFYLLIGVLLVVFREPLSDKIETVLQEAMMRKRK